MGSITQAMLAACLEAGVEVTTDAPVLEIAVANGRATGVVLEDGGDLGARVVVSNLNPKLLFEKLVAPEHLDQPFKDRMRGWRCASGTFRMNVALSELPNFTCKPSDGLAEQHGASIVIAPSLNYLDHAYMDARTHGWARHPAIEMHIPSVLDDSLAPPGHAGPARRQPVLPAVRAHPAGRIELGRPSRGGGRPDHRYNDRLRAQFQRRGPGPDDPLAPRS
jgi:phytoene dehydrogenase-like protein